MSDDNKAFWEIVGKPIEDWHELQVGEIFLLERGAIRQIMEVVSVGEDSFECRLAFGKQLPERHKVLVMSSE